MNPTDVPYYDLFVAAEGAYFIPWYILAAQVWRESGFKPDAVSDKGAVGLAQFMPSTWLVWSHGDPKDPAQAIGAQARYLVYIYGVMLRRGQTDFRWTLAGYVMGPWAAMSYETWNSVPEDVRDYANDIVAKAKEYQSLEGKEQEGRERGEEVQPGPEPGRAQAANQAVGGGSKGAPGQDTSAVCGAEQVDRSIPVADKASQDHAESGGGLDHAHTLQAGSQDGVQGM